MKLLCHKEYSGDNFVELKSSIQYL